MTDTSKTQGKTASKPEKLKMHTPDLVAENIEWIAARFPGCITESRNDKGEIVKAVDFDLLRQDLSTELVEGPQERYNLNWPGKREALLAANAPIAKTLRPCREESVDFDTTKNLFIEGDNLDALKLLRETYLNKVKMIYIDPPYNTGQDFVYADRFATSSEEYLAASSQSTDDGQRLVTNLESDGRFHSRWASMMASRLRLARSLLRDDGLLFISIDDREVAQLQILCDEIFGRDNRIEQVAWKNKYGSGALTKGFANVHEYILVYSKSAISSIAAPLDDEQRAAYTNKDDKFDTRGGYITQPLATTSKGDRPNLRYPIMHKGVEIWPEKQWIWSQDRFLTAYKNDEVVINERNGKYSVRVKQYLRDKNGVERLGKPVSLLNGPFNQAGTKEMTKLLGKKGIFDFPKPSDLIRYFFSFILNDNEDRNGIYMDFFAGSCTSAHAVLRLNAEDAGRRQFIMVQMPELVPEGSVAQKAGYANIAQIGRERITRAGEALRESSGLHGPKLDCGFRTLKIDTSNMKDVYYRPDEVTPELLGGHVDNIKDSPDDKRTDEDLLFQVLLDWGVDLSLPISKETIGGKTVYFVDTNALAACFETGITEDFVKELAERKPLRFVLRDSGYSGDDVKINVKQIFKQLSPGTNVKTL